MFRLSTQKVGINLPVTLRTLTPAVRSVRWLRVRSRASAQPTSGWKMGVSSTICAMQNWRLSRKPGGTSTITRFPTTTPSLSGMPSGRAADADRTINGNHQSLRMPSRESSQWSWPRNARIRPCSFTCINRRRPSSKAVFLVLNSPDSMTCAIRSSSMSIRIVALARDTFQTVHIAATLTSTVPAHHPHSALSEGAGPKTHAMYRRVERWRRGGVQLSPDVGLRA